MLLGLTLPIFGVQQRLSPGVRNGRALYIVNKLGSVPRGGTLTRGLWKAVVVRQNNTGAYSCRCDSNFDLWHACILSCSTKELEVFCESFLERPFYSTRFVERVVESPYQSANEWVFGQHTLLECLVTQILELLCTFLDTPTFGCES